MRQDKIIIILRYFITYILVIITFTACNWQEKKNKVKPFSFPDNVELIFHINHKDNFLSAITNNTLWKQLPPHTFHLHEMKLIESMPSDVDIWVAIDNHQRFVAITPITEKDTITVWKGADNTLQKQAQFGKEWFYTLANNYLIISDSDKITDYTQPAKTPKSAKQQELQQLQALASTDCVANWFVPTTLANHYFSQYFEQNILTTLPQWVAFDLYLDDNSFRYSGITSMGNPTESHPLQHTTPYPNSLADLISARALALTIYSFEDANRIVQNDSLAQNGIFEEAINGVAFAKTIDGEFAIVPTYDTDQALDGLPILSEDFKYNFPIYDLGEQPLVFFRIFNPHFSPKYVGVYEKHLVFAPTKELLVSVVNDMQRGYVLSANKAYQLLAESSASSASITKVANLYDQASFANKYPFVAEHYRWALFQQTIQNDYYVLNFVCQQQTQQTLTNEMREQFRFTVDDQLVTPPMLLTNHRTKQLEIAVQDVNNELYLIDNKGSLLWKKKLDGKIQGEIQQVDLFKNGFLQMIFSTEKTVWVLDRNGNVVPPFPLYYKNNITPVEVFDYDQNREYRFLFAENQTLHLLDRKGQSVKGFFQRSNGLPLFTPQHYRIGDRDYLIYPSKNGVFNILHRNGENRITVKDRYEFSKNPPAVINNLFTFATEDGYLVSIDEKGGVKKERKGYVAPFYWGANRYTRYALTGNLLIFGWRKIELLDGKYMRPQLFRLRGMNYIAVTDTNIQKTYLYDEKGELVKDFPVESTNQIAIDINTDKQMWIVTEKTPTEIVVYTF